MSGMKVRPGLTFLSFPSIVLFQRVFACQVKTTMRWIMIIRLIKVSYTPYVLIDESYNSIPGFRSGRLGECVKFNGGKLL